MKRAIISRDFDPEIAKDVGTDAAIIFQNIWFWVYKNYSEGRSDHYFDSHYWTYNSKKGFQKLFDYLTDNQIRYCLEKLIEKNYLITGTFNEAKYDHTLWYTIGENSLINRGEIPDLTERIPQPIPDNKPNYKPNEKIFFEKTINTPEEISEKLGDDCLQDYKSVKEVVRSKKKFGSFSKPQKFQYQKSGPKEGTHAEDIF
jgi:hypothetical protein